MIEKYTFDLYPEGKQKVRLILVKSDSEQRVHIVLKLLAYLLFYDPGLKIEVDVGLHYKPDLVLKNDDGLIELWIDCGYVSVMKAAKLAGKLKQTRIVLVKETRSQMKNFRVLLIRRAEDASRIEFRSFEPGFVTAIAGALDKLNDVTIYPVTETAIGIAINEQVFESEVYTAAGDEG